MPLKQGSSQEIISANIEQLINEGYEPEQAAAIAYKEAGVSKDSIQYFGTKLSDNITETPEGFLVCHDVIIARTGTQDYSNSEVPVDSKTSVVKIERSKDEVLSPATISSFEGKPVTAGHPSGFVTPENWNELAMGFVSNVRAKDEGEDGYIVADLIITNAKAIQAVKDGLREVSCGYEADYTDNGNGTGAQTNILGNHVALVPKGRCGEKCSINDKSNEGGVIMNLKEKLMLALGKTFDAEVAEEPEVKEEEVAADVGDPMAEMSAKLDKLIELMTKALGEEEAEEGEMVDGCGAADEGEEEAVTADADTISRAEIIAPGISKAGDVVTESLKALKLTADGAEILKAFDGMTQDHKFIAVSELLKIKRNATMMRPTGDAIPNGAMTADGLNEVNAQFWAKQK